MFHSSDPAQTIRSEYYLDSDRLIWCYPAQSSAFVCHYPFSPMKGNWKQRLQLVRQLDSCFVSFAHPLSHTLIAILSSSHLSFALHLLFYVFFFSVWNHISVIFAVMYFSFQQPESIYNSLSVSAVHLLFIAPPSSFFPPVSLSLHLFQPAAASPSITVRPVWPVEAHKHIHTYLPLSFRFTFFSFLSLFFCSCPSTK